MTQRRSTYAARPPRTENRGFTLVELLVAVAIFTTIMAGVTLLFTNAVRLSKQGFQNQEAFEISRGIMATVEQDLSRVYVNRDTGTNSTFYGSPYGMTFIMKMNADNSELPDLARVTYVFHRTAGKKNLTALPPTDDEIESALLENWTQAELNAWLQRPTYALLRYVEPGVEDLDSYPVEWNNIYSEIQSPQDYIDGRITDTLFFLEGAYPNSFACEGDCLEQLDRALKRETWHRMLAGGDSADGIPDAWAVLAILVDSGLVPEDFILAENVLPVDFNGDPVVVDPVVREIDKADISPQFSLMPGAEAPRATFFTYRELGQRIKMDPDNTVAFSLIPDPDDPGRLIESNISLREFAGRDLAYWNDVRNMEYQIRATNYAFVTVPDSEQDPRAYVRTGSPLDPRLPESVNVRFTLFFQTPYAGAPDFFETFTQRIELPTGYRRPNDL